MIPDGLSPLFKVCLPLSLSRLGPLFEGTDPNCLFCLDVHLLLLHALSVDICICHRVSPGLSAFPPPQLSRYRFLVFIMHGFTSVFSLALSACIVLGETAGGDGSISLRLAHVKLNLSPCPLPFYSCFVTFFTACLCAVPLGYVGYARVERLGLRSVSKAPSRVLGVELLLICRRSCRRGGTRYNARGIDDDGNVRCRRRQKATGN